MLVTVGQGAWSMVRAPSVQALAGSLLQVGVETQPGRVGFTVALSHK